MQLPSRFLIESIEIVWQGNCKEGKTTVQVRTKRGEIRAWIYLYLVMLYNVFLEILFLPNST